MNQAKRRVLHPYTPKTVRESNANESQEQKLERLLKQANDTASSISDGTFNALRRNESTIN